ncbi:MAG: phage tail protein [Rhodospirillaceae bacterium]|nr:phage tail protein [Rhodospirillales bacterium]
MTNSRVMMRLGEFGFGVDTASFNRIQTSTKAKWAAVDRIGINPARQGVGWDQTKSIQGVVYPFWRGGRAQIPKMREMVKALQPLLLVDGSGGVHGYWCLEGLNDGEQNFGPGAVAMKWDFSLDLSYYGERAPAK